MTVLRLIRSINLQRPLVTYPASVYNYNILPKTQLHIRLASSQVTNKQPLVALAHCPLTYGKGCAVCYQPFLLGCPLSEISSKGLICNGCATLLAPYKKYPTIQRMIISRLKEPLQHQASIFEPEFTKDRRAQTIIKNMKLRQRRLVQEHERLYVPNSFPNREEIIELARLSRGRCAVSGILGHWNSGHFLVPHPFMLEFDHMVPISMGGSFDIGNLQVLVRCINQVKGSHSNNELRRWLKGFREATKKPIKIRIKIK